MGRPIKLIQKKGAVRKDGTSKIFVQYCYSADERTLLDTGVAIPPGFWNKKTTRISDTLPNSYGDVQTLQRTLTQQKRKAEDMVEYAVRKRNVCPLKFLKENFQLSSRWKPEQIAHAQTNLCIYHQIDEYIKDKESSVKHCTINVIKAMRCHLKSFEAHRKQPITFDSFDLTFYEQFVKFLTYDIVQMRRKEVVKGLKLNSIGKTIKHLKMFLKDRMQKKTIPFFDLSAYKVMEEEVDAVYLSWSEISLINKLDLSQNQNLEKYRDLFVLGCLTGFRFSDYSNIKPEEVRNEMLYVKQAKTLATVIVPLRKEAREILINKYNLQMPQASNPNFNYYIKKVVKLAGINEMVKITHKRGNKTIDEVRPKHDWIMSHTCRRSFCTNEFLDGTPVQLIMAISGHKTEKAFKRYIKADQVQKALMIKKLWDERTYL
jgi:hypothetical protein